MRTIIRDNYTPTPGDYHGVIVRDEVNGKQWIFDCDGVVTDITGNGGVVVVNELGPSTTAATSQALVTEELGKKQDSLSEEQMAVLDSGIDAEKVAQIATNTANIAAEASARTSADTAIRNDLTALTGRVTTAEGDIDTIEDKIPAQATAQNQLADKNFVNSSIATNTANFIGTFNSVAELEAYTGAVTNNDYAFVIVTDAQGNTAYDRYKYNGDTEQWMFEYELNNSSFTAEQWAAINSGITSGNVDKLTGLANIKSIGANLSLSQAGELSATDTTYSPFTGTDGTAAGTAGLVPAPATTDVGKVLGANGGWVTGGPTVVQTTGTSTTDVMSQNAVTSMVYADPETKKKIVIGGGSIGSATDPVAIGRAASVRGNYTVAIGSTAGSQVTNAPGGISLGAFSKAGGRGQMDISLITATSQARAECGYNGSAYRLLTGLYDPQSAHDAATKGYVDSVAPTITMTTTDPGEGATLAENHFIGVYQ